MSRDESSEEKPQGFACKGCGLEVQQPSEAERAMVRPGPAGPTGYCAGCMGGRGAEQAAELLARFADLAAELSAEPDALRSLRAKLQLGLDSGQLIKALQLEARTCIAELDRLLDPDEQAPPAAAAGDGP